MEVDEDAKDQTAQAIQRTTNEEEEVEGEGGGGEGGGRGVEEGDERGGGGRPGGRVAAEGNEQGVHVENVSNDSEGVEAEDEDEDKYEDEISSDETFDPCRAAVCTIVISIEM